MVYPYGTQLAAKLVLKSTTAPNPNGKNTHELEEEHSSLLTPSIVLHFCSPGLAEMKDTYVVNIQ